MFTNEFFHDGTCTTIMDESGQLEDVQIMIMDDCVYLKQYNDKTKRNEVLVLTHKMYYDLIESREHGEGMFTVELRPQR